MCILDFPCGIIYSVNNSFVFQIDPLSNDHVVSMEFLLGCMDIISLKNNWDLHNTGNVWMYLLGDWVSLFVSSIPGADPTVEQEGGLKLPYHC